MSDDEVRVRLERLPRFYFGNGEDQRLVSLDDVIPLVIAIAHEAAGAALERVAQRVEDGAWDGMFRAALERGCSVCGVPIAEHPDTDTCTLIAEGPRP